MLLDAMDPRYTRWVRLTDIYARLCARALRREKPPIKLLRTVRAELARLTG